MQPPADSPTGSVPSAPASGRWSAVWVLLALLAEQRRTNRLLSGLVWSALGFVLGVVLVRIWLVG